MNKLTQLVIAICFTLASCAIVPGSSLGGKPVDDVFKGPHVADLVRAAMRHDADELKRQVTFGADIDTAGERGITPLLWAQLNGDRRAMELLLQQGANANKNYSMPNGVVGVPPPVFVAASGGQKDILKLLLEHGGNPNVTENGISALMQTMREPHYDCAELLLSHGADINYTANGTEFTAFHIAFGYLQYDRVLWVLEHGYTHNMEGAQRTILTDHRKTRPGQEAMREKALKIIADYPTHHPGL